MKEKQKKSKEMSKLTYSKGNAIYFIVSFKFPDDLNTMLVLLEQRKLLGTLR